MQTDLERRHSLCETRVKRKTAATTRRSFSDSMMAVQQHQEQEPACFKGSLSETGNINQEDMVQDTSGSPSSCSSFPGTTNRKTNMFCVCGGDSFFFMFLFVGNCPYRSAFHSNTQSRTRVTLVFHRPKINGQKHSWNTNREFY